jgi:hypothetical protein
VAFVQAIRIWKVGLLLAIGSIALVVSFLLHGTPSHVTYAAGIKADTSPMHTVDWAILGLRLIGGLLFVLGALAAIAYARGEMGVPKEAVPHSKGHDDFRMDIPKPERQRDNYIPPF